MYQIIIRTKITPKHPNGYWGLGNGIQDAVKECYKRGAPKNKGLTADAYLVLWENDDVPIGEVNDLEQFAPYVDDYGTIQYYGTSLELGYIRL